MKKPLLTLAVLSLSASMSACAPHPKPPEPGAKGGPEHVWTREQKMQYMSEMFFSKMDTNDDGEISRAEYNRHAAKWFHDTDTDHNGRLTQDEVTDQFERERAKMMEKHRMCPGNWPHGDKPADGEPMPKDGGPDKWHEDSRSDR